LLRPRDDFYTRSHSRPDDVLLVIEVAETTLSYDRDRKLPVYARAGIAEVWIIDVARNTLSAFRNPEGHAYRDEQVLITPTAVTPALLPGSKVNMLSGLFET
jgi:Uma2 family endonuclease